MLTDTLIEDERWDDLGFESLAEGAAVAALAHIGLPAAGFEIAVLACDDARIADLNAEFREKPTPTNVLSWPSEERGAATDGAMPKLPEAGPRVGSEAADADWPEELGDIAIAYDTCAREAAQAGKSLPDHATHLVVHGVLHLLGFDHIRDNDATLMERLETEILGKMGLPDPYTAKHGV